MENKPVQKKELKRILLIYVFPFYFFHIKLHFIYFSFNTQRTLFAVEHLDPFHTLFIFYACLLPTCRCSVWDLAAN